VLLAGAAAAHASLVESDPPDGATIDVGPASLTATFDEDLGGRSRVVVDDADGEEVARGGISADDPRVIIVELPPLPPGQYDARWTAITPEDGGVTRGTITFTVEPPATPSPDPSAKPTPAGTVGPSAGTATPSPGASATPLPGPSPVPSDPAAASDLILALAVAAMAIGAIVAFLFRRGTG
jgi:hypothetical protein